MPNPEYTKTLRDLREASGRSVENIDAATMIRPANLDDWESGLVETPPLIQECLAALYQVDLDVVTAAAKASREQRNDFLEVNHDP